MDCKFKTKEVKEVIMKEIDIKKAPAFDLVSGKILQELSEKCYKIITFIFNAILRSNYRAIEN
jgi:hypothetical protein